MIVPKIKCPRCKKTDSVEVRQTAKIKGRDVTICACSCGSLFTHLYVPTLDMSISVMENVA